MVLHYLPEWMVLLDDADELAGLPGLAADTETGVRVSHRFARLVNLHNQCFNSKSNIGW